MTDPRIEAVARALCDLQGYHPDRDEVTPTNCLEMDVNWKVYEEEASYAISAADDAAWRPIETAPDGEIWMRNGKVVSLVNKITNHGIMTFSGWGYACEPTHWMPLPKPKKGE